MVIHYTARFKNVSEEEVNTKKFWNDQAWTALILRNKEGNRGCKDMTERVITNIISPVNMFPKIGKGTLLSWGIQDEEKEKAWLTERQLVNLELCFERTPKGYSSKKVRVIGHWNEKGYYAYSKVETGPEFNMPPQYNLDDLKEEM